MTTQNYDITIDRGADFFLILLCRDDSGNLIDLTGAEITAQLREYPESLDYKQFTTEHNGEDGQILLTMAHEDTADIGYTSGVYDVFVELSGGSMQKYVTGTVTVSPSVTRPVYGQIAYLLEFATEADFPPVGQTRRVYFSQATTKMYRWNGTAYVGYTNYYTKAETDALLSEKSDVGHNHDDRYYTEEEMDTALSAKEDIANLKALAYKDKADFYDDIANLPSGYPPSPHNHDDRYYTENEVDTFLSDKADVDDLGTMSAVDDAPADDKNYLRKNGLWAELTERGGSGVVSVTKESLGIASTGTELSADSISSWSQGTLGSASYDEDEETLTIDFGTLPSLSYSEVSIPNISVTSKTVVTDITTTE